MSIRLLFSTFFSFHLHRQGYYINYGKYQGFLETITEKLYEFLLYCPTSSPQRPTIHLKYVGGCMIHILYAA